MAAKRGRISFFAGLPKDDPCIRLDSNIVHYKEVSIFGAFASHRLQYEKALELISSGMIDARKFVTHTFLLENIEEAFATAKRGEGLKVVVTLSPDF
jgi:L-iditol 2-dehydrogenase